MYIIDTYIYTHYTLCICSYILYPPEFPLTTSEASGHLSWVKVGALSKVAIGAKLCLLFHKCVEGLETCCSTVWLCFGNV